VETRQLLMKPSVWPLKNRVMYTKAKASSLLKKAVRSGKRKKKPCIVCGSEKSEGHHLDYSKPLMVMWLCRSHHVKWHYDHGYPKSADVEKPLEEHLKDKREELIVELKRQKFTMAQIKQIFKM
jgi:hypothetical protein